jgi:hypothetical protein
MVAIEWKTFGGKGLGSWYLGWVGYWDAVKKRKFRGWLFLYRGKMRVMARKGAFWDAISALGKGRAYGLEGNVDGDENRTGAHFQ